jgi:hypothetical protein
MSREEILEHALSTLLAALERQRNSDHLLLAENYNLILAAEAALINDWESEYYEDEH